MKIFSNFDSRYKKKVVASYVEEYGSENILVINRSKLFAWLYVYMPGITYTIIALAIVYVIFSWVDQSFVRWFVGITVFGGWFFSIMPVVKKYIDFKLDFGIITPK